MTRAEFIDAVAEECNTPADLMYYCTRNGLGYFDDDWYDSDSYCECVEEEIGSYWDYFDCWEDFGDALKGLPPRDCDSVYYRDGAFNYTEYCDYDFEELVGSVADWAEDTEWLQPDDDSDEEETYYLADESVDDIEDEPTCCDIDFDITDVVGSIPGPVIVPITQCENCQVISSDDNDDEAESLNNDPAVFVFDAMAEFIATLPAVEDVPHGDPVIATI